MRHRAVHRFIAPAAPPFKLSSSSVNTKEVTGLMPTEEEAALQKLDDGTRFELTNQNNVIQIPIDKEPQTFYDELKVPGFHIHQEDGVEICPNFLVGRCLDTSCLQHHTVLPYTWQLRDSSTAVWSSVDEGVQEALERLYSDPKRAQVTAVHNGLQLHLDFTTMEVHQSLVFDRIRRLSTPSTSSTTVPFHTCYKYYYEATEDSWIEYTPDFVKHIKEGLRIGMEEVYCSNLQFEYVLNLTKMYQENKKTNTKRRIRARPVFRSPIVMMSQLWTLCNSKSTAAPFGPRSQSVSHPALSNQYPDTWVISDTSLVHESILLRCEDIEFRHVYSYFHKTMPESQYIIMEISRIQNYFQWEKYERKKNYMNSILTSNVNKCLERHLFHGTDASLVEAICKQNFDSRVCGKHGTLYGQGCYFAKTASYSHSYATATSSGVHHMFLARVLVGRPAVGTSSLRRPPPINPEDPASPLYDSCVSHLNNPNIFVVFDNDQFYPFFLIKYQKLQPLVILH